MARKTADQILAEILRPPPPRLDPDEAERRVREMMAGEVCDLRVAWQVVQARESGRAGYLFMEHICLSADCPHEYMMRLPGPLTREAAERDEAGRATVRRWTLWPEITDDEIRAEITARIEAERQRRGG